MLFQNRRLGDICLLFDLLSALLDSWSLWNTVAGSADAGRRWRREYLRMAYRAGAYRPYEDLIADAACAVGLPSVVAAQLDARYAKLEPWPETRQTLLEIQASGYRVGIVTNCSERLGRVASACIGIKFDTIVTAERAGFYKPDPRPYNLALRELGADPSRCIFVAGSAYDLIGASRVGLPTYWHDRSGEPLPRALHPMAHESRLEPLLRLLRIPAVSGS
jgi:2-haloacid dehalogenase